MNANTEDMGANCPKCGVRITVENAGGYRTYCEDCADEAADISRRVELAESDNYRHIICYLANAGGMRMRAARLVMDTLHVSPREAVDYVDAVRATWQERTPDGSAMRPLPRSLQNALKP